MNDIAMRMVDLIEKYLKDELDDQERQELDSWKALSEANRRIFERLTDGDYLHEAVGNSYDTDSKERIRARIHEVIFDEEEHIVIPYRRSIWRRMLPAAAAVLVVTALAVIWFMNYYPKNDIVKTTTNTIPAKTDIAPGGNKAVLVLADNQRIDLTSASNGNVAQQGNTKVVKTGDGELRYQASGSKSEVYYNTVITPRGGQYQLTLPDGSKVWMNAESSLKFPTTFVGDERMVELTGEAYFEVAKNKARPFMVKLKDDMKVQVLGTHFNVNSYGDEGKTKVTLLEGSVKVSIQEKTEIMNPGEQASIRKIQNDIILNNKVDLEKVMAWKNGAFYFDGEDLEGIMKHLERWYDVEVEYERTIPASQFGGMISRKKNLSEVLKALELSDVHFRIEGRKIKVIK